MKNISTSTVVLSVVLFLALLVLTLWSCPQYKVYKQRKDGEAMLAHAQSSREVAVAEAKAKMEAATLLTQADTIILQERIQLIKYAKSVESGKIVVKTSEIKNS